MANWSPEKCLGCGTPGRRSFVSNLLTMDMEPRLIKDNGQVLSTAFWFCSDQCVKRILETYIDRRYHFDRTAYTDPYLPNDYIEEFVDQWNFDQTLAIRAGSAEFAQRAAAEFRAYADKFIAEDKKATEKAIKQLEAEKIKQLEKEKREQERKEKETLQRRRQELFDIIRLSDREESIERREYWDTLRHEDRERNIRLQQQREADRQADRAKRLVESDELRFWRLENREWQLQERERREQERLGREREHAQEKTLSDYDDAFKWAQVDHELYLNQEKFIPESIPPSLRFEHVHILGPTGVGKSTIIKHIALKDFHDYGRDAAHIIIDPKRSLVNDFARLKIFSEEWRDRLIIVDPFDRPAFNIFASKNTNVDQLVSNFAYIFSTIGQKLTAQQLNCFTYCASLLCCCGQGTESCCNAERPNMQA